MAAKYKDLAARLADMLTTNVNNGIYRLPTEAELGRQYQVSRQTVRQALALLASQGLITTRQGSGSYATGLSADDSRNTIALLVRSEQEHIYPELIGDIRTVLSGKGYSLQGYPTYNTVAKQREFLQYISGRPPRGLIF